MPLTLEDIRPFFQVIVYKTPPEFRLARMVTTVLRHIRSENERTWGKFRQKRNSDLSDANPFLWHFEHEFPPSWYRYKIEGHVQTDPILDLENDLLFIYEKDEYLFLHSDCEALLLRAATAIERYDERGIKVKRVSPVLIKRVIDNSNVKFSTVGMDNVFNAGGTAPEAKTYYGPEANTYVTPVADGGYGLSYSVGRDTDRQSKQIGCSIGKRKIWRTWVDNFEDFVADCDKIVELMDTDPAYHHFDLLVEPITAPAVTIDDVLLFYMDYTTDKGLVYLKHNDIEYGEWECHQQDEEDNIIEFTLFGRAESLVFRFAFEYDGENGRWDFTQEGAKSLSIAFANEGGEVGRSSQLLETYLNAGTGFSLICTEGRAFRNGAFWLDNRYSIPFYGSDTDTIPTWADGVNIEVESDVNALAPGEITILNRLDQLFRTDDNVYVICDDDAHEVADYLLLSDTRFVLAHAKAAGGPKPGLSISILQVVASQAIKNLRYFKPEHYSDDELTRLHDRSGTTETLDEFKASFLTKIRSRRVQQECWIVQPGISRARLEADERNKIHCLMNFVDSNCTQSNIRFRLICSV